MSKQEVEIFVVSHLDSLLDAVPSNEEITKLNLDSLDIPEHYRGNHLAESRFFFARNALRSTAVVIGFASARWHERFPSLPKLDQVSALLVGLKPHRYFAPMTSPVLSSTGLEIWIAMQDLEHPGMGRFLRKTVRDYTATRPLIKSFGYSVMGGQIFAPKDVFVDLQHFVVSNINTLYEKYGLFPPFKYSCSNCGRVFQDGVGRWSRVRHLGFLAERLISLYFILNSDLLPTQVIDSKLEDIRIKSRQRVEFPAWVHLTFARLIRIKNRFLGTCDHS